MALSAIVLLGLLALASAAPQCSTSCNAPSKLSYAPGTTYTYDYTGKHTINIDGVEDGSSTSDYSATVTVTIVNPCDVAISLQNVVGSNIAEIQEKQYEKYPLMVAMQNGKFEKVCSHPEDDVSSINVKKAIASAFQNVLPSFEPTLDPQVYTEEDIVGICPTKYSIEDGGDKTVVTKEKIHSNCHEHYYSQTKTSILPEKTPLPIQDSKSSCIMEITNGIYSTIRCKDTKYITPGFGIFKVVKAAQEITLQLASEGADESVLASIEEQVLNSQSLGHQQELPIKNPALVPTVDAIMSEICTLSQGQSNKEVASLVAQAIQLLGFVPDEAVVEVLAKIRTGQYCAEYTNLESLFLDAVAFIGEPGAFKVMAQEIAAGRTTGGRFSLYTVTVNLLTRPTLNHVAALTPIFEMPNSNQLLSLAASTVVNRYCTQNVNCGKTAPVIDILNVLSTKLENQCTPDFSNVETTQVLTTLKTFGNIGVVTPEVYASVIKCATAEGIETNVRFAAAMSFKGSSCVTSVTQGLKAIVLDASMNTEVRIGSYLAAVQCADENDFEEVITAMSSEANKQVQGFILSHLENLLETNWPLKQNLRERLSSKTIPNDYIRNILKYSRNIEMSVNAPITELGGLVESNIVYTPESYVPRLVNLGLNMNLLGSYVNIGEIGVRVEGFDPYFEDALGSDSYLYKEVFGPDSYLYKTPLASVIEDSKVFMTQRGAVILQQIQTLIKENDINPDTIIKAVNKIIQNSKDVNADSVLNAFNEVLMNAKNIDIKSAIKSIDFDSIFNSVIKFLESNKILLPKTDLYAIIRAQERAFLSFGGEKNSFTITQLVDSIVPVIMNAIVSAQDLNIDTARTGQINIDYTIPTISGIPLTVKLAGTGVAGIQLKYNLNDALLKIVPSLNAQIEGQIGFGELLNTGLKLKTTAYTTNGFALNLQKTGEGLELQVELPEKMEIFNFGTEMFFMKLDKASNEVKIIPSYIADSPNVSIDKCLSIIEPVTGLLVCTKMSLPDVINIKGLPLAQQMMFKLYLKKSDEALKGYRVAATLKNEPNNKLLMIAAGSYGSAESKETTLSLTYSKEEDKHLVSTIFQSTFLESTSEFSFINQPGYKSLQYYTNKAIGPGLSVEGSAKVEFKLTAVENGNTYEVATYAGFTKSLDEKNRLFQVLFSLLENDGIRSATVLTKTDLFPVTVEAGIELPSDAGLNLKTKVKATLPMITVSAHSELKYENGVISYSGKLMHYDTELLKYSSTIYADITSPKMSLKFALPVADLDLSVGYTNGMIEASGGVNYLNSNVLAINAKLSLVSYVVSITSGTSYMSVEISLDGLPLSFKTAIEVPDVFFIEMYHKLDLTGLTTVVQVKAPAVIKPLQVKNVFGISNAFSYTFLTDVTSGDLVVFHVEGPLIFAISSSLVQQNLDLKISGAFDGNFKVMHETKLSLEKFQYKFDVRHTSTQIVSVDVVLDRTNSEEIAGKVNVNVPFVIESEYAATISTSLIHNTMNALVLPSTDYARRFKGYATFNWVENNFKGEFLWDAEKDNAKKVELSTKYALDTVALKLIIKGELTVTSMTFGYTLESILASPFDFFQGNSGLMLTVTMPSEKMIVAKAMLDVQYADLQVTLNPLIEITTTNENIYKLSSIVMAKLLPAFLNFDVSCETTLSTPQLQQITLVSKLLHDYKDQSGKLAIELTLKESVLSQACSVEYILEAAPLQLKETLAAKYGGNQVSLVSDIVIDSGLKDFKITHELNTPLAALLVKLSKTSEGPLALAFVVNGDKIVNLYYNVPALTNHIVGIEIPSRTIEFGVLFASNQVSFKILPAKNKNDKVVEVILRLTPKATALQFEALVTAPSLTKEMRFAVELELIEPGKEGYDMASIDVQYQVYEAPELFKATLMELQSIYGDLVNDGLFPDLNELYKLTQNLIKQLPENLNIVRYHLMVTIPQFLKQYALDLYQLYEPDLIALWNKIQSDLLMYWNTIKTEAPVLINNYVEVIKKTEVWNVVQLILNEVMYNYPAYYDAAVDFYNKVIVPYLTDLSETVSRILVLPEFDFQKYLAIVLNDVPELFIKLSQRVLDTQLVQGLRTTYPAIFEMIEDLYNQIVIPTYTDILKFIQKVAALPLDFQSYLTTLQIEVPVIATQFGQRLLDTKIVINLKAAFPNVFVIVEDVFNKIILPTFADVLVVAQKLISLPVLDIQESIVQYWNILKVEVPALLNNFVERLPNTELLNNLKTLLPTLFVLAEDFYNVVVLPTIDDVVAFVDKLVAIPLADIQEAFTKYLDILKVEVPTLMSKIIQRIPNTQVINFLQARFDQLSSFLQIKFNELKDQNPELYAIVLDFYTKVAVPAVSDLTMLFNKIIQITDVYQLRDFVVMDVLSFVNNLLNNISTTDLFSKLMAVFDQVIAAYPDEYDIILKTYKQMTEVTVGNVISAINSYLFEKFGMSFSISAEKFTAVFPLPVNVATVKAYYQMITVYAPAYAIEALSQGVDQGRLVYKYIEAQVPAIIDYITSIAPIYLQYVNEYVQMLQVVIPQFINDMQAVLPEYIEQAQAYVLPYVKESMAMMETSYNVVRASTYGKLAEEMVKNIIDLIFTKFNEIVELYPNEIKAVQDFVVLYVSICTDYATWIINTVFEHPIVQKILNYIATLTPEKAQADLTPVLEFVMSVLRQVQSTVNELIATLPKDIPSFVKLHIPFFGLLDYLK